MENNELYSVLRALRNEQDAYDKLCQRMAEVRAELAQAVKDRDVLGDELRHARHKLNQYRSGTGATLAELVDDSERFMKKRSATDESGALSRCREVAP